MLFILRKLRKSFFLPGKLRTYLAYAAGEIVLIVVGILIAVQIGDWNQERKDRAEETQYLRMLHSEMQGAKDDLEADYAANDKFVETIEVLLKQFVSRDLSDSVIAEMFLDLTGPRRFTPPTAVLDDLISTGKISLLKSEELRHSLNSYTQEASMLNTLESRHAEFQQRFMLPIRHSSFDQTVNAQPIGYVDRFLKNMEIKNTLASKRRGLLGHIHYAERILANIESILDLIDAELKERGARPPSMSQ